MLHPFIDKNGNEDEKATLNNNESFELFSSEMEGDASITTFEELIQVSNGGTTNAVINDR